MSTTTILLVTAGVEVGILIGAAHEAARSWIRQSRYMVLHAVNSLRSPV